MSGSAGKLSRGAAVRARLNHPIVDTDGHAAEFEPLFFDFLREAGGPGIVDRYKRAPDSGFSFVWNRMDWAARRDTRTPRPNWWAHPTKNTLDRATSSIPRLMRERLPEMGLDFSIIYPSLGLNSPHMRDEELRRAACHALNNYHAEVFAECADRLTPVAVIPMHTPAEAIAELDHAIGRLKLKAIVMPAYVRRPIPALARRAPELEGQLSWFDSYGIDSEHDYDPVWARCVALGVAPTFHSKGTGIGFRGSISNFMHNHIGHFAATAEAVCKALFFGGVTRRFPTLRFAFQEGGVGWARVLYGDLIGHWRMHRVDVLDNFDPARLDRALFVELCRRWGGPRFADRFPDDPGERSDVMWGTAEDPADRDEFARLGIERAEDFRDLFTRNFYFGCEGDDDMTALAFDARRIPFGARLNAIFGSDLGHRDLFDMRDAAAEPWELVEHGLIGEADFRDFVFANPVRLHGGMNPEFFAGTAVASAARRLLAGEGGPDA